MIEDTILTFGLRQLTKSLLKADFGLTIEMPSDRLCPPVPVRWNYIRWLQDLIDNSGPWSDTNDISILDVNEPRRRVTGLDIGVGASCIYSLLACASRPNWHMYGTDIDEHSLGFARANVSANGLLHRITLLKTTSSGPLIPLEGLEVSGLDFVMTNPPFYSSSEDMKASYAGKNITPSAVCLGAENEMICPGGDLGFAMRIFGESLQLRERVQWFSVMFGRLKSAETFVTHLKTSAVTNFAASDLQAGFKTKRWVIAWSHQGFRPRNDVSRHGELVRSIMPDVSVQTITLPRQDAKWAGKIVNDIMNGLNLVWQWQPLHHAGAMCCNRDVWSRSARRKRKFDDTQSVVNPVGPEASDVALAVIIACKDEAVEVRWLRGRDRLIFESFCGKLKRAMGDRLKVLQDAA
jgi:23S rRNA (adenine1618-N6)-methyltransferase